MIPLSKHLAAVAWLKSRQCKNWFARHLKRKLPCNECYYCKRSDKAFEDVIEK